MAASILLIAQELFQSPFCRRMSDNAIWTTLLHSEYCVRQLHSFARRNQEGHRSRNLDKVCNLLSTFIASPGYINKRMEDAMICASLHLHPKWFEIKRKLLSGQRRQIRPYYSRLPVKDDTTYSTHPSGKAFGDIRAYVYIVEWQKRAMSYIQLIFWRLNKINANDIESYLRRTARFKCGNDLVDIRTAHMIHGPCGSVFNMDSTCIKERRCSKRYPRHFLRYTQTGTDGYPFYCCLEPADGGITLKIGNSHVDNRWIVPYRLFFLKYSTPTSTSNIVIQLRL